CGGLGIGVRYRVHHPAARRRSPLLRAHAKHDGRRMLRIIVALLALLVSVGARAAYWQGQASTPAVGGGSPFVFQHIATSTNPTGNGIVGRAFAINTESLPP